MLKINNLIKLQGPYCWDELVPYIEKNIQRLKTNEYKTISKKLDKPPSKKTTKEKYTI